MDTVFRYNPPHGFFFLEDQTISVMNSISLTMATYRVTGIKIGRIQTERRLDGCDRGINRHRYTTKKKSSAHRESEARMILSAHSELQCRHGYVARFFIRQALELLWGCLFQSKRHDEYEKRTACG